MLLKERREAKRPLLVGTVILVFLSIFTKSQASSHGYTEQFCIPGVTSVFFSSCDSVVGDSLEFNQANRGSLRV